MTNVSQQTRINPDGSLDGMHYTCPVCWYQNPVTKVDGKYIDSRDIVCYGCRSSERQRLETRRVNRAKWLASIPPKKIKKEYVSSRTDLKRCREIITAVLKHGKDDEIRAWWDFVQLRGKEEKTYGFGRDPDMVRLYDSVTPCYQTILNAMRAGKHMGWLEAHWIGICGADSPWAGAPNKTMRYVITEKGRGSVVLKKRSE